MPPRAGVTGPLVVTPAVSATLLAPACGSPPPPAAPRTPAAASASSSVAAPQLGEVEALFARFEQECPGAHRTWPAPRCEANVYWQMFQAPGDEAAQLDRGRQLVTLLRSGTPAQRAHARANLLVNQCLMAGNCGQGVAPTPGRSICRDERIAVALVESLERDLGEASAIDPRGELSALVDRVAWCLDFTELQVLCEGLATPASDRARVAKRMATVASARPADAPVEVRSAALFTLCTCEASLAGPLVKRAAASKEPPMRAVASRGVCAGAALAKPRQ